MPLIQYVEHYSRKSLTRGAYGSISTCNITNVPKMIVYKHLNTEECVPKKEFSLTCIREIACLSLMSKLNISTTPKVYAINLMRTSETLDVFIYMDYINMDLRQFSSEHTQLTRISQINHVYDKCIKAIATLHKFNIIHCDIKNQNILVNVEKGFITDLFLTDYSLSTDKPDNPSYSDGFRAPHLPIFGSSVYPDRNTDLYALGITMIVYVLDRYSDTIDEKMIEDVTNVLLSNRNTTFIHTINNLLSTKPNIDMIPEYTIYLQSTQNTPLSKRVEDDVIAKEIVDISKKCELHDDITSHAIEISRRYLASNASDPLLPYGSLLLAISWNGRTSQEDCELIYKLTRNVNAIWNFAIDMITKLDGLIYDPT